MANKTYRSMQQLFSKRRRWVKGMTADGHGRYCLLGGLDRVYPFGSPENKRALDRLWRTIDRLFPGRFNDPVLFNDDSRTRFTDIQKVIRRAGV